MIAAQYIVLIFGILLALFTAFNFFKGRVLNRSIFSSSRFIYKSTNKSAFWFLSIFYFAVSLYAIFASIFLVI